CYSLVPVRQEPGGDGDGEGVNCLSDCSTVGQRNFRVTGDFFNNSLELFGHYGCRVLTGGLLVSVEKRRIFKDLANRFLQDLRRFLRCTRRKNPSRTG